MSTYRIDQEIGRGGMAVVYAGWHEQLERPVALKVLAVHLAGDAEFRARFLREARIASKLHHPNLVQTFDITEVEGLPCIVMELVTGGTLEDEDIALDIWAGVLPIETSWGAPIAAAPRRHMPRAPDLRCGCRGSFLQRCSFGLPQSRRLPSRKRPEKSRSGKRFAMQPCSASMAHPASCPSFVAGR